MNKEEPPLVKRKIVGEQNENLRLLSRNLHLRSESKGRKDSKLLIYIFVGREKIFANTSQIHILSILSILGCTDTNPIRDQILFKEE